MQVIQRKQSVFGALGKGLGEGIANHIPKEIERSRLASGLKALGEKQGLTHFQQFAELAGIPGISPQAIQTGGQILRQLDMLQGAQNQVPQSQQQFDAIRNQQQQNPQNIPKGVVGTENTQAALQPAIPKNLSQLQSRAGELNKENPKLYPDYPTAFEGAKTEDQQLIAQNQAKITGRGIQKGVESDIREGLKKLQSAANAKVPDNVYQKIEDEAIDAVRNGKDELTAGKNARDKLDAISRDYQAVSNLGNAATLIASNPKEITTAINSLREKFKANGDLENFADALVARNNLSNEYAHAKAMPPPQNISKMIKDLPLLKPKFEAVAGGGLGVRGINKKEQTEKTQDIIKKIAPLMGKDDSPLAIGNALTDRGYDSQLWKKYLLENKDKLNLSQSQVRELEKVDKIGQGFLNDWFLKIFGG